MRTLIAAVTATFLLFGTAEAHAQVQVSDQFVHVARELAKRAVATELAGVCTKRGATDAICKQVIDSLTEVFLMAIDGHLDGDRVALALRDEFSKIVQATATELGTLAVKDLLAEGNAAPDPCSASGLAGPVAGCFVARAYKGPLASAGDCEGARKAMNAVLLACGVHEDPSRLSKLDVVDLMDDVQHALVKTSKLHPDAYAAVVIFAQLAKIVRQGSGGFYAIAQSVAKSHEALMVDLEMPDRAPGTDESVQSVLDKVDHCPGGAAIKARLEAWKKVRTHTFLEVARAVAKFHALPADMATIPDDLPDPGCSSASDPLVDAVNTLRRDFHGYRIDVTLAQKGQQALLPAMLVAILVDYVRTGDEQLLLQSVRDFALEALARVIAASEASDEVECQKTARLDGLSCRPVAGGAAFAVPLKSVSLADPSERPDDTLDDLVVLVESRHSAASARRTCLYQAVAALVAGSFETFQPAARACRRTGRLLDDTVFSAALSVPAGGDASLSEWTATEFVPSVVSGRASLRLAAGAAQQRGFEMLDRALSSLAAQSGVNTSELLALQGVIRSLAAGLTTQGRRELLTGASDALRPQLTALLDAHLVPLGACRSSRDPTGLECAVRVLVDSAYDPVMSYVSTPGATDADRQQLVQGLLVRLDGLDPLGMTPLLFNIGPGMTSLSRFGSENTTVHLTLLDKFGLAYRWGDRRQWEAGVFVGGFVDAIIRKSVGATDADPYWLSGGTVGIREFTRAFPFGMEGYVASANPFDLPHYGDKVALGAGLNLIVPVDIVFSSSASSSATSKASGAATATGQ